MKLINDKIISGLNEELGLRFLSEEKRSEILTRVLELVSKRAGMRIVEKFSDEETAEFNKIPKDNLEQMEDFMLAKNSGAEDIFSNEAEKVKEELLSAKM
ncbi:MAG: DUF5663 domain-containing protein [Patescibacteria group bacterium]|nr:DUF5663 domain-containing protein [Patescibacteria group bacterium]